MARLFDKVARVTVSKPTGYFSPGANAIVITSLRIRFEAKKGLEASCNEARVIVTNLGTNERALFQAKPLHVLVEAGYDGQPQRLFSGDVRWSNSQPVGPEWETTLELADGDRAWKHSRVNRSFRGGVVLRDALRDVASSMGLTLPEEVMTLPGLQKQFQGGLTLSGTSRGELTRILAPLGLSWSIQDGKLQILSADGTVPGTAVRIAQDTGMIGSPELASPEKSKRKSSGDPIADRIRDAPKDSTDPEFVLKGRRGRIRPALTVKHQLYPGLRAGGRILLDSLTAKGLYKLIAVRHTGDTHGATWQTELDAVPV